MANMTIIKQFQNIDVTNINGFVASKLFNNTMQNYIIAGLIFLFSLMILKIFKVYIISFLNKLAKRTKTHIDDILIEVLDSIKWPFYVYLSIILASKPLVLSVFLTNLLNYLLIFVIVYYSIIAMQRIINYFVKMEIKRRKAESGSNNTSLIKLLGTIGKFTLWIIGLLVILSNIGIQITPLIASLGIGGLAIAFALQKILEDLFSSFAIYFDKPFEEGDFIIVGTDVGVVKHIGLKSTRIKALQGQELVISNTELINTRINNYKQMEKRRIAFSFGVEYSTSSAKLKKINGIVKKIITDIKLVDFDRCHFKTFGDFSLNFEVVYYVNSKDYIDYMDNQQEINFAIKQAFEKEKIEMAFPTQTVILQK